MTDSQGAIRSCAGTFPPKSTNHASAQLADNSGVSDSPNIGRTPEQKPGFTANDAQGAHGDATPAPRPEALPGDARRLEWMAERGAFFNYSGRYDHRDGSFFQRVGVSVPCRTLYEWHVYDGADFRQAIDRAMAAPPCGTVLGECANSGTIAEFRRQEPGAIGRITDLESRLAVVARERDEARGALERIAWESSAPCEGCADEDDQCSHCLARAALAARPAETPEGR